VLLLVLLLDHNLLVRLLLLQFLLIEILINYNRFLQTFPVGGQKRLMDIQALSAEFQNPVQLQFAAMANEIWHGSIELQLGSYLNQLFKQKSSISEVHVLTYISVMFSIKLIKS